MTQFNPGNDPLKPAYPPDITSGAPPKPHVALGGRRNLVGLLVLITLILALFVIFGRDTDMPAQDPTPAAVEEGNERKP